jgi:hypothetical protein
MRRVVGWAVFVGALVGLGALIHAGTPPVPRWRAHVGQPADANVARLSEDDKKLVLCPWVTEGDPSEQPVRQIDVATGRVEALFPDTGPLTVVQSSPSGRWVAAVSSSVGTGTILHGLDTRTGDEWRLPFAKAQVGRLEFSLAEEHLLVEVSPQLAHVIDTKEGRVVATLPCGRSHHRSVWAGRRLFHQRDIGGEAVVIWDGRVRGTIPGVRYSFSVSADGRRLLDGRLRLWDLSDPDRPALVAPLLSSPAVNPQRCGAELTPDGRYAVVVPNEGPATAEVWDAITGHKRCACRLTRLYPEQWLGPMPGRPEMVWTWASHFPGTRSLQVLDLPAGRVGWKRQVGTEPVFAPDGRTLLLWLRDTDTMELTDAASGEALARWRDVCPGFTRARFEAGGRMVWLDGRDDREAAAATLLERLMNWIRPLQGADALVGIDLATGQRVFDLRNGRVQDYVVARDGSFVLTFHDREQSRALCRWDVPAGKPWANAISVPLVLGAALLGLRAWWERRVRTKQPEGPMPSGLTDD